MLYSFRTKSNLVFLTSLGKKKPHSQPIARPQQQRNLTLKLIIAQGKSMTKAIEMYLPLPDTKDEVFEDARAGPETEGQEDRKSVV